MCVSVNLYVHMSACVLAFLEICVYPYIYIYIYIYIYLLLCMHACLSVL